MNKIANRRYIMANKKFFAGIPVIILVFGMMIVGCEDDTISDGGSQVDTRYRGTYRTYSYSGTTSLTTTEYTYVVAATKTEYIVSTNGTITTDTIYDEAWTEGRDLWVRGNITRSYIGTFDENGSTLTVGTRVFTKGSTMTYSLNGTWVYASQKYIFSSGNFELYYNDIPYKKGTYITNRDNMTMTVTHLGRYSLSSYTTYLDSSKDWYTKDDLKTAYLNYYKSQLQQTYNTYVASYGTSTANSYFQSQYGTTNIDSIVQSQYGNSIDTSLNTLYANAASTVIYALSDTLFLGGITYTKE